MVSGEWDLSILFCFSKVLNEEWPWNSSGMVKDTLESCIEFCVVQDNDSK